MVRLPACPTLSAAGVEAAVKALQGGVQRVVSDMRTADGRHTRAFQEPIIAQWGPLPSIANSMLREAARLDLELFHAGVELDGARQRGRRREIARLRRAMVPMRGQLTRLLEQIQMLAKQHRPRSSLAALLTGTSEDR
jgi:hypothetical protein